MQSWHAFSDASHNPILQMGFVFTILKLTLCPNRSLMLSMPYRIIVGRSKLRPHAITLTSGGSPMGCNISGRNMPLFPTSIHLPSSREYLQHARQPQQCIRSTHKVAPSSCAACLLGVLAGISPSSTHLNTMMVYASVYQSFHITASGSCCCAIDVM